MEIKNYSLLVVSTSEKHTSPEMKVARIEFNSLNCKIKGVWYKSWVFESEFNSRNKDILRYTSKIHRFDCLRLATQQILYFLRLCKSLASFSNIIFL